MKKLTVSKTRSQALKRAFSDWAKYNQSKYGIGVDIPTPRRVGFRNFLTEEG